MGPPQQLADGGPAGAATWLPSVQLDSDKGGVACCVEAAWMVDVHCVSKVPALAGVMPPAVACMLCTPMGLRNCACACRLACSLPLQLHMLAFSMAATAVNMHVALVGCSGACGSRVAVVGVCGVPLQAAPGAARQLAVDI